MAFSSLSSSFSLGQYVPADSPVHRLDPRAKTLLLLAVMIAVFPADDPASLSLFAFLFWASARLSGVSAWMVLKSCRPIVFFALFSFFFNFAAGLWGAPFLAAGWEASFLPALPAALRAGFLAAARLLLLVLFASLLPLTTAPVDLADGFESLLSPFQRLGLPARELAMVMSIALRFIPLLAEEAGRIVKAQLSRGARLDQGGAVRRMIAFFPVIVPLFALIFRRADELALAMEARGYRGGEGRTRRRPLTWKKRDTGAVIFAALLLAALNFSRVSHIFCVFDAFRVFCEGL